MNSDSYWIVIFQLDSFWHHYFRHRVSESKSLNYGSLPFNHQWMILVSLIWSFYIHELIHKLSTVRDGYLQYHNWGFRSLRYQHCFDCSLRESFPETLSKMGTMLWPWADDEYGLQPNNCTSVHNALSHCHPTTFYMHKPHWNRRNIRQWWWSLST